MVALSSPRPDLSGSEHPSDRFFRFARAEAAEELAAGYRIRYQVYCVERGFFDPADYPSGREEDAFDAVSVHILATHSDDGQAAGTVRLVLNSPLGFPLQGHCTLVPGHEWLQDPGDEAAAHCAEISRLAVSKLFRRRAGDGVYGGPPRRRSAAGAAEVIEFPVPCDTPEILFGIHREIYQQSKRLGITHWIVAMERGLAIILERMGSVFAPIGPKVDYFGPVRPYVMSVRDYESNLHRTAPATLNYMTAGLEPELLPMALRGLQIPRTSSR